MFRIRRFGVIRTATVVAVMYLVVVAVIFIPIALLVAVAGTTTGPSGTITTPDGTTQFGPGDLGTAARPRY